MIFEEVIDAIKKNHSLFFYGVVALIVITVVLHKINKTDIQKSDLTYHFLTEPIFNDIEPFSKGIAAFMSEKDGVKKWGYIDTKGKVVVQAQYASLGELKKSESHLAYVDKKDMNNLPEVLVPVCYPNYGKPSPPPEELISGRRCGFVDKNKDLKIPPIYESVKSFEDGLAAVQSIDNHKWGYINHEGKYVIYPQYQCVKGFSDGYAAVSNDCGVDRVYKGLSWFFINKKGQTLSKAYFGESIPHYETSLKFIDGFTEVRVSNGFPFAVLFGSDWYDEIMIDNRFKFVGKEFAEVKNLKKGLIAVRITEASDSKWALVSTID